MPSKDILLPHDIVSTIIMLAPKLSINEEDFIESVRILHKRDKRQIRDAIDFAVTLRLVRRHNGYLLLNKERIPEECYTEEQ